MTKYTRAMREEILEEYREATGREYLISSEFLEYVKKAGPSHPAYDWFEWDDTVAGHKYRLEQSLRFTFGLRHNFKVEVVHGGPTLIRHSTVPVYISPREKRANGGGKLPFDQTPEKMMEWCGQAGDTLRWFISKYSAALDFANLDRSVLDEYERTLAYVSKPLAEAAE